MKNNGGPAFPSEQGHCPDGTWNQTYDPGMTLRDYLAGQALMGYNSNPNTGIAPPSEKSRWCIGDADAILAERAKEQAKRGDR